MYTLKCRYRNRDFSLTWEDGEFRGDPSAIFVLEARATAYEDEEILIGPPTGPFVTEDYLANPLAALWLVREVFEVLDATGDVPEPPEIPVGAVA